jgi:predicted nucleic acid-binding protein
VSVAWAFDALRLRAEILPSAPVDNPVCADQADDKFLFCADAAEAQFVVSGDRGILRVSGWRGIRVVTPRRFLSELDRVREPEPVWRVQRRAGATWSVALPLAA